MEGFCGGEQRNVGSDEKKGGKEEDEPVVEAKWGEKQQEDAAMASEKKRIQAAGESAFLSELREFLAKRNDGVSVKTFPPMWRGKPLDLYGLYRCIIDQGGVEEVVRAKKWQTIWQKMKNYDPKTTDSSFQLKCHYVRYLYAYEQKKVLGKETKLDIPELTRKFGTNCIVKSVPGASLFGDQQVADRTKREPRKRDRELNAKRKLARSSSRVHLPYKRPFYKLALQQHEIEQDLALILNSKRRRTTRGASHQASGMIDDMSACTMLLLRLRNHEHGTEFNRPVPMSSWPQVAKDRYLQLVSSPIDLGMIQARLSCGEYNHPVLFADDVRLVFRNAAMCAERESELMKRTIELWELFEKEVAVQDIAAAEPIAIPPVLGQGKGPTTARSKTLDDNRACCNRLPGFRVSPLRQPPPVKSNTGLVLKMMYVPAVGDPTLASAKPRTKGKIFRKPKKLLSYEAIVNGSRLIQDQQNSASEGKSWDTGSTAARRSSVALSSQGTDSRLVVKLSHTGTKSSDLAKVPVGKRSLYQLSKVDESSAYVGRSHFDWTVAPITVARLGSNSNIQGHNDTVEATDEPEPEVVDDAPPAAAQEVPSCREASTRAQNVVLNNCSDGRIDRWNAEQHKEEKTPKKSGCESNLSVCSMVTRVGGRRTAVEKVPGQVIVRREKSDSGKGCGSGKRDGQIFPDKAKVEAEYRKPHKKIVSLSATEGRVRMSPSKEEDMTCSETTVVSSLVQDAPISGEGGDNGSCIAQVERMHTGRNCLEELKGNYSPGFEEGPLVWKKSRPRPCSQGLPKRASSLVPQTTTLLVGPAVSNTLLSNRGSDAVDHISPASCWQEGNREDDDRGKCLMTDKTMASLSEGTRAHYAGSVRIGSEQLNREKGKGVKKLDYSGACVREHQRQGLNSSRSEWAMTEENKQRDGSAGPAGGSGKAQEADAWDPQSGKSHHRLPAPRSTGSLLMESKSPSTFSSLLPSIQSPQNWQMASPGTTGTLSWNMACL